MGEEKIVCAEGRCGKKKGYIQFYELKVPSGVTGASLRDLPPPIVQVQSAVYPYAPAPVELNVTIRKMFGAYKGGPDENNS